MISDKVDNSLLLIGELRVLNPIWLKTFVTLIDTGHFTKAAEKLFMTQPGVSQHISKLESACGHELIKRDKKSFVITEQGQVVYDYALQLGKQESELLEKLAFDDPYVGDISIACSGSLALLVYPQLLKLQSKHSNLVIGLKASPNYQILEDVKAGRLNQGVVTDIHNKMWFDIEELGKEELCLIVPASTTFDTNKAETLLGLGLITHPDAEHYLSLYFAQSAEPELKQLELSKIPVVGSINQIGQILEPIAQGIGFTVLPKSAVDSFPRHHLLEVLRPKQQVIETLYLVKKKNRDLPARYGVVNHLLKRLFEKK